MSFVFNTVFSRTRRTSKSSSASGRFLSHPSLTLEELVIYDGEINFLWSFIQGSIMIPETWERLLRGFGFCERHAWAHISIEMAFRRRYLLAPAILYSALLGKALHAVSPTPRSGVRFVMRKLRARAPCFLCAMDLKDASAGASPPARLIRGRDSSRLQDFAAEFEPLWRCYQCRACTGQQGGSTTDALCRQHLAEKLNARSPVDLSFQRELLRELSERITRYERSFSAGGAKASDIERAGLVAAVGWCSGWRLLLGLLAQKASEL